MATLFPGTKGMGFRNQAIPALISAVLDVEIKMMPANKTAISRQQYIEADNTPSFETVT